MKQYKTGVLIKGDSKGAVSAAKAAAEAITKLNTKVKSSGKYAKESQKSFNLMSEAMKYAKPLIAGWGAMSFANSIRSTIDYGDKLNKLELKLHDSTEALSELQHVAGLQGISFDALAVGLTKLSIRLGKAVDNMGPAQKAFELLGLDAHKLNKLMPTDALMVVTEAMQGVESQAKRNGLAFQIFGNAGTEITKLMELGTEGIKKYRQEAVDLGLSLDSAAANDMATANDAIARMSASWTSFSTILAAEVAPMITKTMDTLREYSPLFDLIGLKVREMVNGIRLGFSYIASATAEMLYKVADAQNIIDRLTGSQDSKKYFAIFGLAEGLDRFAESSRKAAAQQLVFTRGLAARNKAGIKTTKTTKAQTYALEDYLASTKKTTKAEGARKASTAKLTEAQKWLSRMMDESMTKSERYEEQLAMLDKVVHELNISSADAAKIQAHLADKFGDTEKAAKKVEESTDGFLSVMKDQISGLDSVFDSVWDSAMGGAQSFGDSLKGWFQGIVKQLATYAITNPIKIGIMGILGASGTASAGGSLASAGQSILGGSGGGMGSLVSNLVSPIMGGVGSLMASVGTAIAGIGTAGGFLSGIGAGITAAGSGVGAALATGAAGVGLGSAAGIGMAIGAAVPFLLPIVALLAGSLFGGKEASTKYHFSTDAKKFPKARAKGKGASGSTVYGGLSLGIQHTGKDGQLSDEEAQKMAAQVKKMFDAMKSVDDRFNGLDGADDALERIKKRLDAIGTDTSGKLKPNQFISGRYDVITQEIGGVVRDAWKAMTDIVKAEGSDMTAVEIADISSSLATNIEGMSDVIGTFNESLADAGKTQYDIFTEAQVKYKDQIDTLKMTSEGLRDLAGSTAQMYNAQLRMLNLIHQASVGIASTIANSTESIRLSVMSESEQYAYYKAKSEEAAASIDAMTDPELIAKAVAQAVAYAQKAYGLEKDPSASFAQEYLDFLKQVEDKSQAQLEDLKETIGKDAKATSDQLGELMKEAASKGAEAAQAQKEAADASKESAASISAATDRFVRMMEGYSHGGGDTSIGSDKGAYSPNRARNQLT